MGKFDGIMICTDIDGTLTYERGKVSQKNKDAIAYFQKEGGMFVIATGRLPDFAQNFGIEINAPVVALNGTLLYDLKKDETLFCAPLQKKQIDIIVDAFEKSPVPIMRLDFNFNDMKCGGKGASDLEGVKAIARGEKVPYKGVFVLNNREDCIAFEKFVRESYGDDIQVMRSCDILAELVMPNAGKSVGITIMKKLYPNIHTTVAVGDYMNDIDMIRDADIGYAVENALPEVKAVADRIAPKHTEDAIAYIIDELGKQK